MKKIFSYGETLIRYDVADYKNVKMYPTGTSLNFLTNLSRLGNHDLILLSSLSNQKDSEIIIKHLKVNDISDKSFISKTAALGSYTMYKNNSIFGWEVVYNRKQSAWNDFSKSNISFESLIKEGDHIHFDGISLCSSIESMNKTLNFIKAAKKKKAIISFDFNLRKTIEGNQKNIKESFASIISIVDYLNISYYDLMHLLGTKLLDQQVNKLIKDRFPNLKKVFGTKKVTKKSGLCISGFMIEGQTFNETELIEYAPKELIGQGDSFAAYVINQILLNEHPDIHEALMWSIFKTYYVGDSTVPSMKEYKNYRKGINIVR